MSRGYLVIADTQRGQITRLFDTLDAAKRAGMKIWMGGLAERVVLYALSARQEHTDR